MLNKKYLLFLFCIIGYSAFSQLSIQNTVNLGNASITKSIRSNDGKIILLGQTLSNSGNFNGNHGGKDMFAMKIDTAGSVIWNKVIGGSDDDIPVDFYEKQDGSYIIMCNTNSIDGDFTPPNVDYLTWTTSGTNKGGFVVFDLSSNGSTISNIQFGFHHTASYIKPEGLSLTLLSNDSPLHIYRHSIQGGNHILNVNQILLANEFGNSCGRTTSSIIRKLSTNDYLSMGTISGATNTYNRPYGFTGSGCVPEDIFLIKYNTNGSVQWTKNLGGTGYDYGVDFIEKNGFIYLVGNTNSTNYDVGQNLGSMDIYVAKLDLSGNLIKDTTLATSGKDIVNRIRLASNGNLQIAGFSNNLYLQYYELNDNLNVIKSFNQFAPSSGYALKDIIEINNKLYLLSESSSIGPNGNGTFTQYYSSSVNIYLLKMGETPPISINSFSQTNYCVGQGIQVSFTSTLPSGTNFTAQLMKGNTLISSSTSSSSPMNLFIPYSNNVVYGADYYVKVIAGTNSSANSNPLTIGNIGTYNSNNRFVDENDNIITSVNICSGKNRLVKFIPFKIDNSVSNDPITFIRALNGTPIDTNTTGLFSLASNGNYSVTAKQGSCNITSYIFSNQSNNFTNYISHHGFETICEDQSRKITSNYYSPTAQFQWYLNNTPIPNANSFELLATETGTYRISVTELGCNIFPGNIKLTFSGSLNPNMILSNEDSTICNGSFKYMYVSNFQYNPNEFQYQWYKDGVIIAGAVSNSYSTNLPGKYYVVQKQGNCESRSKIKTLISSNKAQKPNFSLLQYSQICNGGSIRLQEVINSPNGNYLATISNFGFWYKDGVKLQNYTSSFYDASQLGEYKLVLAEGTSCQVESDPININIGSMFKPKIYSNDDRTTICGNNLNLRFQNLNVGHNSGFTYQWKINGNNLPNETSQFLYPYNQGGAYSLVVSKGGCSMESDPINVSLTEANLTLITNNTELTCTNALTKINIKEMSPYGFYNSTSWFRNGILIPNEKEPYLYTSLPGIYTATQNAGCIGTSAPLEIKTSLPTGFYAEAFDTVPSGQNVTLSIASCSGTVKWYNEENAGTLLSTGNSYTTPALTQNTSYWVSCTVDFCESSRTEILVHVANPCPIEIIHNSAVTAQEYKTSGRIVSNVNLSNGIKYNAKTHIELSPGFQVGENEVFEAVIGGCDN